VKEQRPRKKRTCRQGRGGDWRLNSEKKKNLIKGVGKQGGVKANLPRDEKKGRGFLGKSKGFFVGMVFAKNTKILVADNPRKARGLPVRFSTS